MRALRITKFRSLIEFETKNVPKPEATKENPLLIKVKYSPINPSDLGMSNGVYLNPENPYTKFPLILGFEGSGIVQDYFKPRDDLKNLVGKSVFFYSNNGCWADYTTTSKEKCFNIELKNEEDFKLASMYYINPLTALSFIQITNKKSKDLNCDVGVLNTAGNSALGKIFTRLCNYYNLKIINTTRKETSVAGFLSTKDELFKTKLENLSKELNIKVAFDCLGGDRTSIILGCLPQGADLYHYGNLSMRHLTNFSTHDLLFLDKSIKGFHLFNYFNKNISERKNIEENYIKLLGSNKNLFDTEILRVFDPENIIEAVNHYKNENSKGKILLRFN